ncbi:hypothetical protein BH23PSE1_BH23PSE1_18320 [soil metagenome]
MSDGVRCMWMRGGTSKGGYFLASELPRDPPARDAFLLRAMGSPDARQIDGMGGGDPLTSKVAVIGRSARAGADVDYLFLQVFVDRPLLGEPELVVPFAGLAHQRGLVAHLLAPGDRHGARAEAARLGDGRAARHQQHRHMLARRVDRADRAVGEADIGVQHHRLGAAGHRVVAVRHAHRGVLVRDDEGARQRGPRGGGLGQPLDDRREVGAGVGEDDIDAERLQPGEDGAAGRHGAGRVALVHGVASSFAAPAPRIEANAPSWCSAGRARSAGTRSG